MFITCGYLLGGPKYTPYPLFLLKRDGYMVPKILVPFISWLKQRIF